MVERTIEIEQELRALGDEPERVRERVDLLNELGWKIRDSGQWHRMLSTAEEARDLSRSQNYKRGLATACRLVGFARYMLAEYETAIASCLEALRWANEENFEEEESFSRIILALLHWSVGNYDDSLREGLRALAIAQKVDHPEGMSWASHVLGSLYDTMGDHDQSLGYHRRAQLIFARTRDRIGEARSLTGIGTALWALGDAEEALRHHVQGLELYRALENSLGEARALNDIGVIYQAQGDYEKALAFHQRSLEIRRREDNRQSETTSLINLGKLYLKQGATESALDVLHRAVAIAAEIGAKPKAYQAHQILSEVYEATGDLARAFEHHKTFHRIREQVFNEERNTRVRHLQIGYEIERAEREAEIERLRSVELKEKNEQLARLLKELQTTQAQLLQTEKMAALGTLVGAIAHELNSPLGALRSSSDVALRCAERIAAILDSSSSIEELRANPQLRHALDALREDEKVSKDAVARIGKIIQSLKSFARFQEAEYQRADLTIGLEDTLTLLEPEFRERITVVKQFEDLPEVYCYASELNQVFMNLLRNAAEAFDTPGTVTISTFADDRYIHIRIADCGRGIPPEQIPRLFDPAFAVKERRVKASMSLFTCFNIVRRHRGEIRVESELGKGSTFTVLLPRDLEMPATA